MKQSTGIKATCGMCGRGVDLNEIIWPYGICESCFIADSAYKAAVLNMFSKGETQQTTHMKGANS